MKFPFKFKKHNADRNGGRRRQTGSKGHLCRRLRFEHLEPLQMLNTLTWTGASRDNSNWDTPVNWSGGQSGHLVPQSGDSVVLGGYSNNNILNLTLANITISEGPLDGDTITVASNNAVGIEVNGARAGIDANIVLGTSTVKIQVDQSCQLEMLGVISDVGYGGQSITKLGAGTLILEGTNTYTGGTIISAGTVQLSGWDIRLATNGLITVNSGGTLDLGGNYQGTSGSPQSGEVSIQGGAITNGTITKSGAAYDGESGTVSASLAGSVGLTKSSYGTLTLSGSNSYSGVTELDQGILSITNQSNLGSDGLTFNGGTLQITSTSTISKTATLNAGGGTIDVTTGNTVTYGGPDPGRRHAGASDRRHRDFERHRQRCFCQRKKLYGRCHD